jgi:hypothetical protein
MLQADDVGSDESELCELLAQLDGVVYRINNDQQARDALMCDPSTQDLLKTC